MVFIKTSTVTFIVVGLILSAFTIYHLLPLFYPERFGYGLSFVAEELSEKPDKYIVLTQPDPYVLEATSNPGKEVFVGRDENSKFGDMTITYGTNNVEIDGKYFRIHLYISDLFFPPLLLIGWFALGIAVIMKLLWNVDILRAQFSRTQKRTR